MILYNSKTAAVRNEYIVYLNDMNFMEFLFKYHLILADKSFNAAIEPA